ncbi:MAG: WbqC family protein [Bacteroidota bacterium]
MKLLLHPGYFLNIANFVAITQQDVLWEVMDNFQKQTYRNRCYICTDIGRHMLTIPIQHRGGEQGRQKYKDVKLDNQYPWQRQHWRTLETAYRTSPFFEFYEDDIVTLYEKEFKFLLDFNLNTIEIACQCLGLDMPLETTKTFEKNPEGTIDGRFLANAKKEIPLLQEKYVQVFGDRHGFVKNLSILDLLFNEGTNTLTYLKNQTIDLLNA